MDGFGFFGSGNQEDAENMLEKIMRKIMGGEGPTSNDPSKYDHQMEITDFDILELHNRMEQKFKEAEQARARANMINHEAQALKARFFLTLEDKYPDIKGVGFIGSKWVRWKDKIYYTA